MARVKREQWMKCMAGVEAGLSPKDGIEQSSCYVFQGGRIWTFNNEVACSMKLPKPLRSIECAVPVVGLRGLLSKIDDDELEVSLGSDEDGSQSQGHLLIETKKRRVGLRVQIEIRLPISEVEMPDMWMKIPDGFSEAVDTVQQCASKDESIEILTCLHLHPSGIEASDNFQAIRYKLKTGLDQPVLAKRDVLVKVVCLGMEEWAVDKAWLHFCNSAGLTVSCRRQEGKFPSISSLLEVEGQKSPLPKGLVDAAVKAEIFVEKPAQDDQGSLTVDLRSGKLLLRADGPLGWYEERQKISYDGESLKFRIAPRLLREVCLRSEECVVGESKLMVEGDRFVYISCLAVEDDDAE